MHPLPVCPRPFAAEAARSWLSRVGQVYGLKAERLVEALGLAAFRRDYRQCFSPSIEAILDSRTVEQLAVAAQLPSARIAEMRTGPAEWTLNTGPRCVVCAACLDEDFSRNCPPYQRVPWQKAWRIFCPSHEIRLVTCNVNVIAGYRSSARLDEALDELVTFSAMVEEHLEYY